MTSVYALHGEDNAAAKLTEADARAIHALVAEGRTQRDIAALYGVSTSTVAAIANGTSWAHLGLTPIVFSREECSRRRVVAAGGRLRPAQIDATSAYADDPAAQSLVEAHPDGMSHVEISEVLGVSRERARQIEAAALDRLRAQCARFGISPEDLAAVLMSRGRSHADRAAEMATSDAYVDPATRVYDHSNTPITDGPLVELEALLSAVEARAEYVDNVTRIARRHA